MAKTSLSAGLIIREMLSSGEIAEKVTKVFPVVVDTAVLPYIAYRRSGLQQQPVKGGIGADTVQIDVRVYTKEYDEGVDIAEAVRSVLDHSSGSVDGLEMRSCTLVGSTETWENDAYVQELQFNVKI